MPEISRFFGIVIKMFFEDHNPPHFHAYYGEHEALINICTLTTFAGSVPPRALGLVIEWAVPHRTELMENWNLSMTHQPLLKIDPLQ